MYKIFYCNYDKGTYLRLGTLDNRNDAIAVLVFYANNLPKDVSYNLQIVIDTTTAIASYPALEWLGIV